MSASTALVEDAATFRKLRNFTYGLNVAVTLGMVFILIPPVYDAVMLRLIGLPADVAALTYGALVILIPWPGAIGYRRFFQGLLIRGGKTRLVAYGTVIRLLVMTTTAIVLYAGFSVPGAYVGAAALSAGVCVEALASRIMARRTVTTLRGTVRDGHAGPALGYRGIAAFYYPLALTSMIGLAVHPMLTFFMGRARFPVESLAVFPVVHALSFIFRALGLSFQEVAIALLGDRRQHAPELGRFAAGLGLAASAGLALVAFTPLSRVWYESISGLSPDLASFAIVPTRILIVIPVLSVLLSFQRALLVKAHHTRPITWATVLEVLGIGLAFAALGAGFDMIGVTAAVIAFIIGRVAGNVYLIPSCLRALRDRDASS